MSDFERNLPVIPEDVTAQIERLREGGIVLGALSGPEQSMDNFVQSHLASVALLNAQGDQRPERPYYIYNPANGTLINYALRRDHNPDRAGLFADIVELDNNGKPRHGLTVTNPFEGKDGFIHVAVGENDNGFAPAEIRFRLDNDDLGTIVPPTIEAADLVSMIKADPIPEGMSLAEFQESRISDRDDMRRRVQERQYANFRGTKQAISAQTDPDYHMIITDRDDFSAFEAASREVGIFPIVIHAKSIVSAYHAMKKLKVPDQEQTLSRFSNYVHFGNGPQEYRDLLRSVVPAFLTYDFEEILGYTEENQVAKQVSFPKPSGNPLDVVRAVHSILLDSRMGAESIVDASPFFAKLFNNRYPVEHSDLDPVTKKQHGIYELPIDTSDAACMKIYTNWLRKIRSDYALTLYLRDISKL